jgi:hypothetical protein
MIVHWSAKLAPETVMEKRNFDRSHEASQTHIQATVELRDACEFRHFRRAHQTADPPSRTESYGTELVLHATKLDTALHNTRHCAPCGRTA